MSDLNEMVKDGLHIAQETGKMRETVRILTFIKEELDKLDQPLKEWSEPALHRQQALKDVYEFIVGKE